MKNKKKTIVFSVLVIAALVSVLLLGLYLGGAFRKGQTAIDGNATKYAEDQNYSNIEESPDISIPGYDTIYFKAGAKKQEVNFYNPKENTCYFKLSLILEDGTVIWTSDLLEPDMMFNEIELKKALSAGTYSMQLQYDCYSLKDQSALNNAVIGITVVAQ